MSTREVWNRFARALVGLKVIHSTDCSCLRCSWAADMVTDLASLARCVSMEMKLNRLAEISCQIFVCSLQLCPAADILLFCF